MPIAIQFVPLIKELAQARPRGGRLMSSSCSSMPSEPRARGEASSEDWTLGASKIQRRTRNQTLSPSVHISGPVGVFSLLCALAVLFGCLWAPMDVRIFESNAPSVVRRGVLLLLGLKRWNLLGKSKHAVQKKGEHSQDRPSASLNPAG